MKFIMKIKISKIKNKSLKIEIKKIKSSTVFEIKFLRCFATIF